LSADNSNKEVIELLSDSTDSDLHLSAGADDNLVNTIFMTAAKLKALQDDAKTHGKDNISLGQRDMGRTESTQNAQRPKTPVNIDSTGVSSNCSFTPVAFRFDADCSAAMPFVKVLPVLQSCLFHVWLNTSPPIKHYAHPEEGPFRAVKNDDTEDKFNTTIINAAGKMVVRLDLQQVLLRLLNIVQVWRSLIKTSTV
jgi:hypothetical protein